MWLCCAVMPMPSPWCVVVWRGVVWLCYAMLSMSSPCRGVAWRGGLCCPYCCAVLCCALPWCFVVWCNHFHELLTPYAMLYLLLSLRQTLSIIIGGIAQPKT